jgi:hypothetical protein
VALTSFCDLSPTKALIMLFMKLIMGWYFML